MRMPRAKLCTLRQYVDDDGRSHFRGWLGSAQIVIYRSDAEPEYGARAMWDCFIEERAPKPPGATAAVTTRPAAASPSPRRSKSVRKPSRAHPMKGDRPATHPTFDDEIGF
ncbi:hypothetical protein [Bosea sp. 2RAB26]|uniref:hypothetical protein n=1 Tax=Bosea sp. 2RAB26 TaxID=3237476 RepID=UPI003F8E22D9